MACFFEEQVHHFQDTVHGAASRYKISLNAGCERNTIADISIQLAFPVSAFLGRFFPR
jgi:hypothetical protein